MPPHRLNLHTELADVPSPRTVPWSAFNKKEMVTWRSCHATLLADAERYENSAGRPRLVLFGDSITESWRGTSYGKAVPRTNGVPAVMAATLAARFPPAPLPLGIAADCTQHLLWRMRRGELSAGMQADPQLTAVLLIGTNNLGRGHSVEETIRGVVACAHHLLNSTRGSLLVNALLPRGDKRKRGRGKGRHFLSEIAAVNQALLNGSARSSLEAAFPRRVHVVDCGAPFLAPGVAMAGAGGAADSSSSSNAASPSAVAPSSHGATGVGPAGAAAVELVQRTLMPDRLHPNAAGHRLWAACLEGALGRMPPRRQ